MLDIIIGAAIALFAFLGWRRGLVKTVYRLAAIIAAIVITRAFYPIVSDALFNNPSFHSAVYDNFSQQFTSATESLVPSAEDFNIPPILRDAFKENVEYKAAEALGNASAFVANALTRFVANAAGALIVFFLSLAALLVVGQVLNIAAKLPVINLFNKAGGLIAGLLQGVAVSWVIIAAAVLLMGMGNDGTDLKNSFFVNALPGGKTVVSFLSSLITKQ